MCGDCSNSAAASAGSSAAAEARRSSPVSTAPKQQEDFSGQEFKAYCQKRLEFFLRYKERQEVKVGCNWSIFYWLGCTDSLLDLDLKIITAKRQRKLGYT